MNFSQEIINVLDYLGKQFGVAIDWTSDSVMPYLEDLAARYIRYEVMSSIAWMIILPVIAILIAIPLAIFHKKANELYWDDCRVPVCAAIVLWIVFVIVLSTNLIMIPCNIFHIIECSTLPEKVIFEYLQTMLNN